MTSSQTTTSQAETEHEAEHTELMKRKVLVFFSPDISSYFIAGGMAGATSRTVVSPLERLKIIQSVSFADPFVTQADSENSTSLTDKSSHRTLIYSTRGFGEVLFEYGGKRDLEATCEEMR
jgi:hypothetical protein